MDEKEIEIKLQLDESDYNRLVDTLKQTAVFVGEKHQVDVYYSPQTESFYDQGDRCLRVRTEDGRSILSYKRLHAENTSGQFIEEYETYIGDPQTVDHILKALEYKSEIIVDKHRIEYCTDTGFMIALDNVLNLGCFIEIENRNDSDPLEVRNQRLIEFVRQLKLDLSWRNTEGYSNMMFRINRKDGDHGVCSR